MLERDATYVNLSPYGEPQLGKRGLYPTTGGQSAGGRGDGHAVDPRPVRREHLAPRGGHPVRAVLRPGARGGHQAVRGGAAGPPSGRSSSARQADRSATNAARDPIEPKTSPVKSSSSMTTPYAPPARSRARARTASRARAARRTAPCPPSLAATPLVQAQDVGEQVADAGHQVGPGEEVAIVVTSVPVVRVSVGSGLRPAPRAPGMSEERWGWRSGRRRRPGRRRRGRRPPPPGADVVPSRSSGVHRQPTTVRRPRRRLGSSRLPTASG